MFKFTYCADELFFQTIFENSPYKNNLYYNKKDDNYISCMRYIDWTRGQPYTFKENDFEELSIGLNYYEILTCSCTS